MNKQDIIAYITPEIYAIESEDARKAAPFTGSSDQSLFYSSDTPFTISQLIWERASNLTEKQKIHLLFEIYNDIPCYTFLSEVYIHYYDLLSDESRDIYWNHLIQLLDQGNEAFSQPIIYTLAVDFFEEFSKHQLVWEKLITATATRNRIQSVLKAAQSVPFPIKGQLFHQLLPDPSWHQAIYTSLEASYYSVYGEIDKKEALRLLEKLQLQSMGDEVQNFRQALQKGQRYNNYYADQRETKP